MRERRQFIPQLVHLYNTRKEKRTSGAHVHAPASGFQNFTGPAFLHNTGGRATRMATDRALRLVRTVTHLTVEAGNLCVCVWCVCVVVGGGWLWLWVERGTGF